jgi:hypothetical protein|tara:strand:+ start:8981 stop:9298 length:318 start_codon:yes stop_codon:yes gene_type:complete
MDKKNTYTPLPKGMTIQPSKIDGLGLFTLKTIKDLETSLGVTHVWYEEVGTVFRTPLGGFINHSETPNCEIKRFDGTVVSHLFPIKTIKTGEEITLKYTMYSVDG